MPDVVLLDTSAGMALVNPVSVGAGLLLGVKAYREDAENRHTPITGRSLVGCAANRWGSPGPWSSSSTRP